MRRVACIRTRGACGGKRRTSTRAARGRAPISGNACKRSAVGRTIRRPSSRGSMRLHWDDLGTPRADKADGEAVELVGWPTTALPVKSADYFLLTAEPNCCAGCLPGNPLAVIEVFADRPLEFAGGAMRLAGRFAVLDDDPLGWRYQLRGARLKGVTRRRFFAASPLVCLPMPAFAQAVGRPPIHAPHHCRTIPRHTGPAAGPS